MSGNIVESESDDGSSSEYEEEENVQSESCEEEDEQDEVKEECPESESDKLRKELADIPLGELQKIKETIGLKKYSQAMFGSWKPQSLNPKKTTSTEEKSCSNKTVAKEEKVKSKKSEPEEKSSKLKIFRPRMVVNKSGRATRDPRFDDLSGHLNEDLFEKSYGFVNDIRKEEQSSVRKQIKKVKNKERKAELNTLLQSMERQDKAKKDNETRKERDRKRKKEEYESVKKGKKAFYLKNSDKKKIELAEKYRNLKESGTLEKYMSKKMKRNASKEKRKLPYMKGNSES